MERKNYTVAVDLGSSSVVVAVGEKTPEGAVDVACVVSKPVEGVNAGRIENIELVSRAIREAVSEAEEQLGIRITEAYAGISGDFVRCARHTDHVFVYDPQNGVNQKDVDALFDRIDVYKRQAFHSRMPHVRHGIAACAAHADHHNRCV